MTLFMLFYFFFNVCPIFDVLRTSLPIERIRKCIHFVSAIV